MADFEQAKSQVCFHSVTSARAPPLSSQFLQLSVEFCAVLEVLAGVNVCASCGAGICQCGCGRSEHQGAGGVERHVWRGRQQEDCTSVVLPVALRRMLHGLQMGLNQLHRLGNRFADQCRLSCRLFIIIL